MARDFAGKTVVVSGAAGGLGRALCQRFALAGARIVALDRDAAALEALDLPASASALRLPCDVSREADCLAAMAQAREVFGGIDLLINNAGITHRSAFAQTQPAVIRRVMEVNYFGALYCTHAALEDLIARRGMVIAISSVAGFAPLIARSGYAASKHALHGFFDSLRAEVETLGVSVMLVCPSFIETGIENNALAGDGNPARHAQQIVGARSTPEAIAEKILRAAQKDHRLLLPDRISRLSWVVSRLAPRSYARIMARRLAGEMRRDPR